MNMCLPGVVSTKPEYDVRFSGSSGSRTRAAAWAAAWSPLRTNRVRSRWEAAAGRRSKSRKKEEEERGILRGEKERKSIIVLY
jgi:hypothetical protein